MTFDRPLLVDLFCGNGNWLREEIQAVIMTIERYFVISL